MRPERFRSGNHMFTIMVLHLIIGFNEAGAVPLRKSGLVDAKATEDADASMRPERFRSGNLSSIPARQGNWCRFNEAGAVPLRKSQPLSAYASSDSTLQ